MSDLSGFIKDSRDGLVREGGLGAVFAILTIFLFLFSLRSTLVAAVSIPLSIFAALAVMLVAGVTINIMTLGGLAVAVGRVVDDAIVVLENIYRHRARGDERTRAVLDGAREVAGAITASTATTVAVFLPLGFVGGLVSQFFLPFALTVTFALLASLLCALTVVPVLGYWLVDRVKLDVDENGEPKRSIWVRAYTPTIRLVLRNRRTKWGIVVFVTVLFLGSFTLLPSIPTQFINAGGEKVLSVSISPPAGAGSTAVLAKAIEAEQLLRKYPNVQLVETTVPGEGDTGLQAVTAAFAGRAANSATILVTLDPSVDLKAYTKQIAGLLDPIASAGYDVAVSEATGFSAGGINVIVSGADPAVVKTTSQAVVAALRTNPDLVNVTSDLAEAAPLVEVTVDPNRAFGAGLTTAQVAAEVRTILVPQRTTRIALGDQPPVDLYVQVDPARVNSVAALSTLPVGSARTVPLGTIADVRQVDAQGSITRIDEQPASSITAEITSENTGAVSTAVQEEINGLKADGTIPSSVTVRLAGITQQQNSAFSGLFSSMAVAILLVYVMMVLTFNSLVTPFIIMFSLPLATIGAFPALFLTGRPIGISSLIGFLDAHRDRRHQRDRPARPGRAAAPRGPFDDGGARGGRQDPRPADPHDRHRDDPGPHPARCRLQPGLDHRRRAGHGRHRRPVQLYVPDPHRHPGRLLARGRREVRAGRSAAPGGGDDRRRGGDRGGDRGGERVGRRRGERGGRRRELTRPGGPARSGGPGPERRPGAPVGRRAPAGRHVCGASAATRLGGPDRERRLILPGGGSAHGRSPRPILPTAAFPTERRAGVCPLQGGHA